MHVHLIENQADRWFSRFWEVYQYSFPPHEQRSLESQVEKLEEEKCSIEAYIEEEVFIGFIIYWQYPTYIYIEHFALSKESRGAGRGSEILRSLIERHDGKKIVLDIDPIEDEISRRRREFYLRLGFIQNPHHHIHPPYRDGEKEFELILMTTTAELSESEYKQLMEGLRSDIITY